MEKGDPRGELIALQLSPRSATSAARERALLAENARAWSGSLDPWLEVHPRVFRRGFLAEARLVSTALPPSALADPAWSTLERLAMPTTNPRQVRIELLAARLRRGAAIVELDSDQDEQVLKHRGLGLAFLQTRVKRRKALDWSAAGWVGLVTEPAALTWAQTRGVLDSAKSLSLWLPDAGPLTAWMAVIPKSAAMRLEVVPGWLAADGWHFTFKRLQPKGPFTSGTAHWRGPRSKRLVSTFGGPLRMVPRGLETLHVSSDAPLEPAARELLGAEAGKLVRVSWPA